MDYEITKDFAIQLDKEDQLNKYREEFHLQENMIYMDGNSLGLLPKAGEKSLEVMVENHKKLGIDAWLKGNPPAFQYEKYLGELMAPLVGANPHEVTIHGNTTINIHSMIATFYKPTKDKNKILVDDLNFPTGRYAIESQIKLKGLDTKEIIKEVKSMDGQFINEEEIIKQMTSDVALVFLPSVLYRSSQLLDVERITKAAHEKNIIIGWDCCHGIGSVPHKLSKWKVDFAVWCTYKYLNGGIGSSAAMFVNELHHKLEPGLAGWFGYQKDKQFDLRNDFQPEKDITAWQTGTPNIFSMAPLEGSLKMFNEIGIEDIREKSLALTNYLMHLIKVELKEYGFSIGNPSDDEKRGGHVALVHEKAVQINEAMKEKNIIPDYRAPNIIRLAPIALYTSFEEIYEMVQRIKDIMDHKTYENFSSKRGTVA